MPGICALMGATWNQGKHCYARDLRSNGGDASRVGIFSAYQPIAIGVSPYVLAATRTSVRGRPPRSGLMSLCSYVLMFPALAAAMPRYGVSPYVSYVAYVLMSPHKAQSKEQRHINKSHNVPTYSACFGIFTAMASIMRRYTPLSSSMRLASWRVSSLICSIVPTCLLML